MGRLTATAVKANLLKPGTYQDGDGLFLKVRADRAGGAGSAQWLLRIQRDGKRQDVGLGSAKTVTLAQHARRLTNCATRSRLKARENRKAMPYVALPGFITALRRKPSFGRLALDLLILTGARSQEVRLAT